MKRAFATTGVASASRPSRRPKGCPTYAVRAGSSESAYSQIVKAGLFWLSHGLRNELHVGMKRRYNAIRRSRTFSDKGLGIALLDEGRNAIKAVLMPHS